jgi:phage recombination protein Bet
VSESNGALVPAGVDPGTYFSPEQVDLIKRQIAKDCSNDELKLFLYQCARTGLDPFSKQIYAIKRKEKVGEQWTEKMSIQTGIDGFRLTADRTGRYAPGPDNDYAYDDQARLIKATAHVMKFAGGMWHKVSASAFYLEYAQLNRDGKPTRMWADKPHIMLGKCAEALALRKAFPAELSGLYTPEEMANATPAPDAKPEYIPPPEKTPVAKVQEVFPGAKVVDGGPKAPASVDGAGARHSGGTSTAPAAPTASASSGGDRVKRLGQLFTMPAPDGLGWKRPQIVEFLVGHFGVNQLSGLSPEQAVECERKVIKAMAAGEPEAA